MDTYIYPASRLGQLIRIVFHSLDGWAPRWTGGLEMKNLGRGRKESMYMLVIVSLHGFLFFLTLSTKYDESNKCSQESTVKHSTAGSGYGKAV